MVDIAIGMIGKLVLLHVELEVGLAQGPARILNLSMGVLIVLVLTPRQSRVMFSLALWTVDFHCGRSGPNVHQHVVLVIKQGQGHVRIQFPRMEGTTVMVS